MMVRDVRWCRDATMRCDASQWITLIPVVVCECVWHVLESRCQELRVREQLRDVESKAVQSITTAIVTSAVYHPYMYTYGNKIRLY